MSDVPVKKLIVFMQSGEPDPSVLSVKDVKSVVLDRDGFHIVETDGAEFNAYCAFWVLSDFTCEDCEREWRE